MYCDYYWFVMNLFDYAMFNQNVRDLAKVYPPKRMKPL